MIALHKYLGILLVSSCFCYVTGQRKSFCYYSSESQYRRGIGKFVPSNIDPKQCTHIIFAFANVTGLDLGKMNWNDYGSNGLYAGTTNLKQKRPGLKVLIAVGGWVMGSAPFIDVVKDQNSRSIWVQNVVSYLRKYDFDGLDMDWEFPGVRGSGAGDKFKFSSLMRMLQRAFQEEAWKSGKEKLLLTLATAAGSHYIAASYEPKEIIKSVDYMLLMAYNYHGQWENTTGHHSSLYSSNIDKGKKRELNQIWSINYWLGQGMPKERLIVGLGTYGMSYTLKNSAINGLGSPASSGGRPGSYTGEKGILAYFEICENLRYKGWRSVWIPEQQSPYAYGGDQWVGYDDTKSIAIKARYIVQQGLGGAFVWSVEMDDFTGSCGEGLYPLLNTINKIIKPSTVPLPTLNFRSQRPEDGPGGVVLPPQRKPTINQPAAAVRSGSVDFGAFVGVTTDDTTCPIDGVFPDPDNCHNFYLCVITGRKYTRYHLACPGNTGYFKWPAGKTACMWRRDCPL
ncbi:chitotriosidase-1 [Patella vulgata]|uniref:chitotriosidase-1 n=1 Tax=Patella vulgata TaxID=6465 RepID=UPI0024A821EA|nr:chitotriosidase-1 [Patella vulgata]